MDNKYSLLFGDVGYGSEPGGDVTSSPANSVAILELLHTIDSPTRAIEVHREIQRSITGDASFELDLTKPSSCFQEEGNKLFTSGQFLPALEKYNKAKELVPHDHRLYSNSVMCYLKLYRFQEAIAQAVTCTSILAEHWPKGHALLASSYARLGFVSLAKKYLKEKRAAFGHDDEDFQVANKSIEQIASELPAHLRGRQMSNVDISDALYKLMTPSINNDEFISLLVHCTNHALYRLNQFDFERLYDLCATAIDDAPRVAAMTKRRLDFATWSSEDLRTLHALLTFVYVFGKNYSVLLFQLKRENPAFYKFFRETAIYLATPRATRDALLRHKFGQQIFVMFSNLFWAFVQVDVASGRIFLECPPFDDFLWLTAFAVSMFCVLPPSPLTEKTPMLGYVDHSFDAILRALSTQVTNRTMIVQNFPTVDVRNQCRNDTLTNAISHLAILTFFDMRGPNDYGTMLAFCYGASREVRLGTLALYRPEMEACLIRRLKIWSEEFTSLDASYRRKKTRDLVWLVKSLESFSSFYITQNRHDKDIREWTGTKNALLACEALVTFTTDIEKYRSDVGDNKTFDQLIGDSSRMIGAYALVSNEFVSHLRKFGFLAEHLAKTYLDVTDDDEDLFLVNKSLRRNALFCLAALLQSDKKAEIRAHLVSTGRLADLVFYVMAEGSQALSIDVTSNSSLVIHHLISGGRDECFEIVKQAILGKVHEDNWDSRFVYNLVTLLQKQDEVVHSLSDKYVLAQFYVAYGCLTGGMVLASLLQIDRKRFRKIILRSQRSHLPTIVSGIVQAYVVFG